LGPRSLPQAVGVKKAMIIIDFKSHIFPAKIPSCRCKLPEL